MKWDEDRIIEAFNNMKKEGWHMTECMTWGFYFFNQKKNKLDNVIAEVIGHGYHVEEIKYRKAENEWMLYLVKDEILTSTKLHKRNLAFNELANYCGVLYDGWDVCQIQ